MPVTVAVWSPSVADSASLLEGVFSLYKSNKRSLGFLPDAAFHDRANAGALIVAMENGGVVGYTIYDRPRSHLKLVHVCVDTSTRMSRVASLMVDKMVETNPNSIGFEAHCRRSYNLNDFWRSLGMSPKGERPGRGLTREPLTIWWRPLGGPDLFDHLIFETSLPLAVLDSNIVIDLVASALPPRPHRESSRSLTGDWFDSRVNISVSPEVDHELNDLPNAAERNHQRAGAQNITVLATSRPKDDSLERQLRTHIGEAEWASDDSLVRDVYHLADAINAGAQYFVTHDENLIRVTHGWVTDEFNLRVLMPFELIADIESADPQPVYQPRHLAGILTLAGASTTPETDLLTAFLNYPVQERKHTFIARLRNALAQRDTSVLILKDEDGHPLGLIATCVEAGRLSVPLIRVRRGVRAQTLALQLARQLREIAHDLGLKQVHVIDDHLHPVVSDALLEDGFRLNADDGTLLADVLGLWVDVSEPDQVTQLAQVMRVDPEGFASQLTPSLVAELERRYWPLKLWDATASFFISIRPENAMNLFGYPSNLITQRQSLGLARSHVYFRSPRNNPIKTVPARVVWYCSADKRLGVHSVFAYSRIVGSHMLTPEDAHARYSHMGVYKVADIAATASKDLVHVVEFEDTELLRQPLSLADFRVIAVANGLSTNISPSPSLIPPTLLRRIYETSNGTP
ncbi:hypothetical protein [Glaciibacter superstes]|uniref:hypothetical protein n=1 Tax=Glaciibacter superstes TaxID=501023 RepID=UPI0012FAFF7C|nr:hypothetical protein [Glaciibacter superstes]